LELNMIRFLYF